MLDASQIILHLAKNTLKNTSMKAKHLQCLEDLMVINQFKDYLGYLKVP